jgi:hypothetical protein
MVSNVAFLQNNKKKLQIIWNLEFLQNKTKYKQLRLLTLKFRASTEQENYNIPITFNYDCLLAL